MPGPVETSVASLKGLLAVGAVESKLKAFKYSPTERSGDALVL
ncbi:hypothetical protein ASAC_0412 [Acidilobus saccharovorans 345-15]|uniref:Uncharacterized protein n=1 Tax=Acidilobus saccharovorans (strain DSM 16705 / JCM 18335 / VKM B-2471 / 345-15) TaxID=666510 RepID=D9Q0I1_ACIS3|nr:hypothetical protein ASAC_0412 [Acidilobus saccharovorans 345-15]